MENIVEIDNEKTSQTTKKKRKFSENSEKNTNKVVKNGKNVVQIEKKLLNNESEGKIKLLKITTEKKIKKSKLRQVIKSKGSIGSNDKFKKNKGSKLNQDKNKKILATSTPGERKELLKKRKQKKLAENYEVTINMKKIWETLRKSDTTEETKRKLCCSLYEQVKGRIKAVNIMNLKN